MPLSEVGMHEFMRDDGASQQTGQAIDHEHTADTALVLGNRHSLRDGGGEHASYACPDDRRYGPAGKQR